MIGRLVNYVFQFTQFCYLSIYGYLKKFHMANLTISNTMSSTLNYRDLVLESDDLPT